MEPNSLLLSDWLILTLIYINAINIFRQHLVSDSMLADTVPYPVQISQRRHQCHSQRNWVIASYWLILGDYQFKKLVSSTAFLAFSISRQLTWGGIQPILNNRSQASVIRGSVTDHRSRTILKFSAENWPPMNTRTALSPTTLWPFSKSFSAGTNLFSI